MPNDDSIKANTLGLKTDEFVWGSQETIISCKFVTNQNPSLRDKFNFAVVYGISLADGKRIAVFEP